MDLRTAKIWDTACKNPASDASHWTATPIRGALSWLIAEVERLRLGLDKEKRLHKQTERMRLEHLRLGETLRAQNAELVEALDKFGCHLYLCNTQYGTDKRCICGLADALAKAK